MKKQLILFLGAVAVGTLISGCAMCKDPIGSSCIEGSHPSNKQIMPEAINFQVPQVQASPDRIIPRFKVGNVRITAIGVGNSLEEATSDAIINFKKKAQCDYIVAVNTEISQTSHPTWRIFTTTNYSVSLTGLPVFLDRLDIVEVKEQDAANADAGNAAADGTAMPICSQSGLIKLSDISVQINAKGESADSAAVIYPVAK